MSGTTIGGVHYNVTLEDVKSAANSCDNTAEEVDLQLATLKNYVLSMQDMWQGAASQRFAELMQDWDILSATLITALRGIGGGLRGTYGTYYEQEQTNLANLQKVQGSLPAVKF